MDFNIRDFAYQLIDLINENDELREENKHLIQRVRENDERVDREYQRTMEQAGALLNKLADKL